MVSSSRKSFTWERTFIRREVTKTYSFRAEMCSLRNAHDPDWNFLEQDSAWPQSPCMIWHWSLVWCIQLMTEPFSLMHFWSIITPYSFKVLARISEGKYVRAAWSGLFSEQCNSIGTQLQCRAAYHPVSPLMNINQRRVFTAAQTTKCTLAWRCN